MANAPQRKHAFLCRQITSLLSRSISLLEGSVCLSSLVARRSKKSYEQNALTRSEVWCAVCPCSAGKLSCHLPANHSTSFASLRCHQTAWVFSVKGSVSPFAMHPEMLLCCSASGPLTTSSSASLIPFLSSQ